MLGLKACTQMLGFKSLISKPHLSAQECWRMGQDGLELPIQQPNFSPLSFLGPAFSEFHCSFGLRVSEMSVSLSLAQGRGGPVKILFFLFDGDGTQALQ